MAPSGAPHAAIGRGAGGAAQRGREGAGAGAGGRGAPRAGRRRRTTVVSGAGAVGLLSALVFTAAGFETRVWSAEPATDPRAEWLAALGIAYVPATREPLTDLGRRFGAVDVLVEATGAPAVAVQHSAMHVLGGVPPGATHLFSSSSTHSSTAPGPAPSRRRASAGIDTCPCAVTFDVASAMARSLPR